MSALLTMDLALLRTGSRVIPIPGPFHKRRVLENLTSVNVTLSQGKLNEIHAIMKRHQVHPRLRQEEGLSVMKRIDLLLDDVDRADWSGRIRSSYVIGT